MNKIFKLFIALVLVLAIGCQNKNTQNKAITTDLINNPATADGNENTNNLPIIQFDADFADLGILIQGEKVEHTYKFKNIGKSNLIISDASASCGCTVPSFSKTPIAPGQEGEIKVVFNSSNRTGRQMKTVTIWSNAQPNQSKLSFECEIVVPK